MGCDDQSKDGTVSLNSEFLKQEGDQLGNQEDTKENADPEWN